MPAILGDQPIFNQKIQIVKPFLPQIAELHDDVQNILQTGMVTKGKYLEQLESTIAQFLGVKYAIGVSSCTTGLMLTYKCLGLTGEVIVPSFTFMATVSSMVWCNLFPVYIDVDKETTNLDPAQVENAITKRTSAIVAVHNFGNPAEIQFLEEIAKRHQLKLIFDAAHGFGSLYQGHPVGSQGDVQVFSLSPTKLLITGEGGIVATNDDELAKKIRMGREYGNDGHYDSALAGMNARLGEFNCLLGLHSLKMLETAVQNRNEIATVYQEILGKIPGIHFQVIYPGNRSSYKDFSITIDADKFGLTRDELALALLEENVDTRKYYEPPVHRQYAYRTYYQGQALPNTEYLARTSLSLPMWSNMSIDIAMGICEAIVKAHENSLAIQNRLSQLG
jgi:dTDP-4-amino-4,6-dideoxygalactose transaminase